MSLPKKSLKLNKQIAASIIIPAYNQAKNLEKLLNSLKVLIPKDWEIIVIDDASSDDTPLMVKKFPVRFHRFTSRHGPAKARNTGAKLAKGEILVFFDADILLFKKTLKEALRPFQKDPRILAVSGMWAKAQKTRSFFPQFKALRDWSYFFKERALHGLYYFTPRVAAIKKSVFLKVGGFNTRFKKADLESLEFTFRLAKLTPIYFNPKFLVQHEFAGSLTQIKNYFKRTYFFLELFPVYRQFCRTVSTGKEALTASLAAFSFFLLTLAFFYKSLLFFLPLSFGLYLYQERVFLRFFFAEKGLLFTLKSLFFNYLLHLVIFTATAIFTLKSPLWWLKVLKNL